MSVAQRDRPLVSVIMNCLNCEQYLKEAIDSVFAQTYHNWEIVFWDNCSSDSSADIAKSYSDDRLRYCRGEKTVSLGHARNLAIQQCRGEFIAILDCDDLWLPEKLEKQVPLFLADEEVGLIYTDSYFFNNSGKQRRFHTRNPPFRGRRFHELLNKNPIISQTAVMRRTTLDSLDEWFDEQFSFVEEHDLFVRIGLKWKIDYVPEVLAKWRVHDESLTWQEPDSFITEKRIMLDKLQTMPEVREKHSEAMANAWNGLAIREAVSHWKKGEGRAARSIIVSRANRKLFSNSLWMATFLPYKFVESIYTLVTRVVTPSK